MTARETRKSRSVTEVVLPSLLLSARIRLAFSQPSRESEGAIGDCGWIDQLDAGKKGLKASPLGKTRGRPFDENQAENEARDWARVAVAAQARRARSPYSFILSSLR
jgi:hypothetical protein